MDDSSINFHDNVFHHICYEGRKTLSLQFTDELVVYKVPSDPYFLTTNQNLFSILNICSVHVHEIFTNVASTA